MCRSSSSKLGALGAGCAGGAETMSGNCCGPWNARAQRGARIARSWRGISRRSAVCSMFVALVLARFRGVRLDTSVGYEHQRSPSLWLQLSFQQLRARQGRRANVPATSRRGEVEGVAALPDGSTPHGGTTPHRCRGNDEIDWLDFLSAEVATQFGQSLRHSRRLPFEA